MIVVVERMTELFVKVELVRVLVVVLLVLILVLFVMVLELELLDDRGRIKMV